MRSHLLEGKVRHRRVRPIQYALEHDVYYFALDLLIRSVSDIAPSYVRTLRAWRTRFMDQRDSVRGQGFDERFIRMWEYYLAYCEAGFATGLVQDHQIVLQKGRGTGP